MKTVIKLAVMLVIAGSNFVWADDGGGQSQSVQLVPSSQEASPSMRVITEREIDGTDPITITVNQSLIVPLHYNPFDIENGQCSLFFGPDDQSLMSVTAAGVTPSAGGCLDLNLICTGLKPGQVTLMVGYAGEIKKSLSIQVVE
ncbi:MAG: hypothetical protein FJ390_05945 [Verrucomicrobia bacterium]|nr:hypothetical protein [Verrucomicrobiota bacterium]